jgi:rhodanese-related sulfurtransferase
MTATMPTIGRQELHDAIQDRAIVPLDAQGAGWYEREHLPTAVRARPQDLGELEHRLPGGKDTPVAVYCWSETCIASQLTAQHLIGLGYRRVRRYVGGKRDWTAAALPLEGGEP